MSQDNPQSRKPEEATDGTGDDWRDVFYLNAFLHLSLSDRSIARRERVWIKRFLENRGKPQLNRRMEEIIRIGRCDAGELQRLVERAAVELSMGAKRRFIFNLAQLFQSRGSLSTPDYERILDLGEKLGVPDTEADAMLHSVYRINDTFFAILGLLATGTIVYLTRSALVPLVIALFITMIISRVDGLIASALHLPRPRWFTTLAAMVAILGVVAGLVAAAVVSGTEIAGRLPEYQTRLAAALQESSSAGRAQAWLAEKGLLAQLQQLPIANLVKDFVASLLNLVSNFVLVLIFTGFLVPSSSSFTGMLAEMNKKIGTYISTKSLISLLTGVVVFVMCTLFGIDFALFWALLAFLLNYIPVVGAIVAALPPILLAVITLHSWSAIVGFALVLTLANLGLGQVLEPKLLGARLSLRPVAVLVGLIFWGLLWGIPGMFLATPLMVLIRILSSHFNFSRSLERLLATDTT